MWPTLGQFTTFEKNRTNVKKKLSVHSSVASFTENTLLLLLFSHSVVSDSETPWTHQAPLSMGLTKQEYWNGLPFPTPGDLPDPGMEPLSLMSPALASGFFITAPPGEPQYHDYCTSFTPYDNLTLYSISNSPFHRNSIPALFPFWRRK